MKTYGSVTYEGQTYKTVVIGSQTWFQRNLNYAVEGSKCGVGNGPSLTNANTATCDTYGRLYDWATAMALPSKCNSIFSANDIDCTITTPNHRGICPSGWHIPSDDDWYALERAVGRSTAGITLRTTNGWNASCIAGTDDYGFAALPGGGSQNQGDFDGVGRAGVWWSSSEIVFYIADNAYGRYIICTAYEDLHMISPRKEEPQSVRCLQD